MSSVYMVPGMCALRKTSAIASYCARLLEVQVQSLWSVRAAVRTFVQLRLVVFICKSLMVNAMKRLTIKFCVLRPHKNGSGKNNFQ